jgi:hypothetical protein
MCAIQQVYQPARRAGGAQAQQTMHTALLVTITLLVLLLVGMERFSVPSAAGAISSMRPRLPAAIAPVFADPISGLANALETLRETVVEVAAFIWCFNVCLANTAVERDCARGK